GLGAASPAPTQPDPVPGPLPQRAAAAALSRSHGQPRPAAVAIGGITPANAGLVVRAGADSIAVISGLFEAPDIRAAAQACA
ncbi:thiamine phosphate synthase, partial [Bordetella holmesii]|uniref:thiamine phosphate synthase n=1 Tax=Bordetella holmesii TaxID=35814 RepID=UPI001A97D516